MKEYLQYIRKFIWSSVKPSARKWFWVIVVVAVLAFLVLFGILRYKMEFSVTDSGYIGWLFTARAVLIILFSSGYLHYRNSSVYWGNRAYNAAKAAGATNPGAYYQYVQEHFQDSLKKTARTNIRRLENTRSISQE